MRLADFLDVGLSGCALTKIQGGPKVTRQKFTWAFLSDYTLRKIMSANDQSIFSVTGRAHCQGQDAFFLQQQYALQCWDQGPCQWYGEFEEDCGWTEWIEWNINPSRRYILCHTKRKIKTQGSKGMCTWWKIIQGIACKDSPASYTVWIVYTVKHLLLELTVWYLSGNSRLTAASTREKEPPSHSRLSVGIKCLPDTYLETTVWRPPPHGCLTVHRTTASQLPANGRLAG